MDLSSNVFRRGAWLAGPLLLSAWLAVEAGRQALADLWAGSASPGDWERAARLEPGNAEHWARLGRYRQWDFTNGDLAQAADSYRRAVALNPTSPFHWMSLASAYEMQGDAARARQAFEQARRNYPISSEVAWNFGNFLVRAGEIEGALEQIRRALERSPSLVPLAVSVCWRAGVPAERIFAEVLPPRVASYLDTVDGLVAEGELDAALKVWERLERLPEPFDARRSFRLVDALIQSDRIADAARIWHFALRAGQPPAPADAPDLVWDGGFERAPLQAGFSWRWPQVAGVRFELADGEARSGARSLRITFEGTTNVDLAHPEQYVAVAPGTRYRFQAALKLDRVTTDRGVRFHLFDPRHPQALHLTTPELVGTHPWTVQQLDFTAPGATRLLVLQLRRAPSAKLDRNVRGRVWVDDVGLTPLVPGEGPEAR